MGRLDQCIQTVTVLLLVALPCHAANQAMVDDGDRFGCFSQYLEIHPKLGAPRVGLVRVERAYVTASCRLYLARVVRSIHGFTDGARLTCSEVLAHYHHIDAIPRAWPLMEVGREYLLVNKRGLEKNEQACAHQVQWTDDIVVVGNGLVVRSDLRNIQPIFAQITELVHVAIDLPASDQPAAYRRWALENMDTSHPFLRSVVERELASNPAIYHGMPQDEAEQVAAWSEHASASVYRFEIIENLVTETPHPMEKWLIRMLKPPPGGAAEPHDTASYFAFDDTIAQMAPRLSIEPFLPMLTSPKEHLGALVRAFAVKADPRLLPVIVPHLKPGPEFDPEAVTALGYYKGSDQAAKAVIDIAAPTKDLWQHREAAEAVVRALRGIGTSAATSAADAVERAGP